MKAERFLAETVKTIETYQLLERGDRVLVACSGGPDSIALLHVLWRLRERYLLKLGVFHLNHGLRPTASQDEALVKEMVKKLKLKGYFFRKDVQQLARQKKISIEEAGRLLRYRLLEELAERFSYTKIAVAHHVDDVAETFLMRLIQGASLEGISAIPPKRGRIIRPLIERTRRQILAYLEEEGLSYCIDETNLQGNNLRARLRREIMPALLSINPRFPEKIAPLLFSLREDAACLEALSAELYEQYVEDRNHMLVLPLEVKKQYHPALVKRVLRRMIIQLKGDAKGIKRNHLETVYAGMDRQTGFEYRLPGKLVAVTEYGKLLIGNVYRVMREEIEPVEFTPPAVIELKPTSLVLRATVLSPEEVKLPADPWRCYLDADRAGKRLKVRSWKRGDRMRPLGMTGTQKLHDLFVNERVPRRLRRQTPLVIAEDGGIAWAAGLRVSEDYRITPSTRRVYLLEVFRKGGRDEKAGS